MARKKDMELLRKYEQKFTSYLERKKTEQNKLQNERKRTN